MPRLRGCGIWAPNFKDTFLLADTFWREVFLQAPPEWGPSTTGFELDDVPVAVHRVLPVYILDLQSTRACVDFVLETSPFDPCLNYIGTKDGCTVGAIASRIDDILLPVA